MAIARDACGGGVWFILLLREIERWFKRDWLNYWVVCMGKLPQYLMNSRTYVEVAPARRPVLSSPPFNHASAPSGSQGS